MSSSIFNKLSKQSRHRDIFDSIDENGNPGNLRHANTLEGMKAMGLTLQVSSRCCGRRAIFAMDDLIGAFGGDRPLSAVRFACCGGAAIEIVPVDARQGPSPNAGELFRPVAEPTS